MMNLPPPHPTFIITFRPIQDWVAKQCIVGYPSLIEHSQKFHFPNLPRGQHKTGVVLKNNSSRETAANSSSLV